MHIGYGLLLKLRACESVCECRLGAQDANLGPEAFAFQAKLLVLSKEGGVSPADHRDGPTDNREVAV